MVRAYPNKPETWNPALAHGRDQVESMRKANRDDQYIATMLFQTCQHVPAAHFQKFINDLGVKHRIKH